MGSYNRFILYDLVTRFFRSEFDVDCANDILKEYPFDMKLRTKFNVEMSKETQRLLLSYGIFNDMQGTYEVTREDDKLYIKRFYFKNILRRNGYFHKLVLIGDDSLKELRCIYFKVYRIPFIDKRIIWKMKKVLWTSGKK